MNHNSVYTSLIKNMHKNICIDIHSIQEIKLKKNINIEDVINLFLAQIENEETRKRYCFCFKTIIKENLLHRETPIFKFVNLNLNNILDQFFKTIKGSRSTQQTCAAAFISLFKFISRFSNGKIKVPIPQKAGIFQTFKKIRNKTVFDALSLDEVRKLISFSYNHSHRMGVFVEMAIQSAKRLNELINVRIEDIIWEDSMIKFCTSKIQEKKEIYISFPSSFFERLKNLIQERTEGFVFVTKTGKSIQKDYIWKQLQSIVNRNHFPKKVSPHTLRATSITLYREYGFSLDELIDITGHSNLEMVRYYDKRDLKKNPSCKISLI